MTREQKTGEAPRDLRIGAVVELTEAELPAYCPNRKMPLWSWHPRVFLDIVNESEAMCPYCGTRYRLASGVRERALEAKAPEADSAAGREGANLWADARGNTRLELITRWLTRLN